TRAVNGAAAMVSASGAIVVSSDPFFTHNRKKIVVEGLSHRTLIMTYPVFEYLIPRGDKRTTMIFGPLLDELYYNFGAQAVQILTTGTVQGMTRATPYYFGKQPALSVTDFLFRAGEFVDTWAKGFKSAERC